MKSRRLLPRIGLLAAFLILAFGWKPTPAPAYIGGPPATLGMMCWWSTHVCIVQVEKLDREKGVLIFRKIRDIKGVWPTTQIKQNIGVGAKERNRVMQWAEVGKITAMFALESYKWSHTYIDNQWYACNTPDWQWFTMSHEEPILLRTYAGKCDRLIHAVTDILANKEVIVPCMEGENQQALLERKAKIQRVRSSLKLLDYNAKRDFVNWGSDDFRSVAGMPGFSHSLPLSRIDPEAQGIAVVDLDNNGAADFCLLGAAKAMLLHNGGDYFNESYLPGLTSGARSAAWADYNGDGKPDLLLATPTGPKLYTNLGQGLFRDDTAVLPTESYYSPTAVAWIDANHDGWPDILMANGFHGLRLYRNRGKGETITSSTPIKPLPGQPPVPPPVSWFEDRSDAAGLGDNGFGSGVKGDVLQVTDINNDGYPDFFYNAGPGMLFLNTPKGFEVIRDTGVTLPAKSAPVLGDFDNDGLVDLIVPYQGGCKLFKNLGNCRFADVTEKSPDLSRFAGWATSAAWGDVDNDGQLDLVVGCLKGGNRYFRNRGDGTFVDATETLGLHQRLFNTQAVCLADLNNDGVLDMIFANEGQESCVLLGNPKMATARTPLTLLIAGSGGADLSRIKVLNDKGTLVAQRDLNHGGKGQALQCRFALAPGTYQVRVRYSVGLERGREITVGDTPLRGRIDETTPALSAP